MGMMASSSNKVRGHCCFFWHCVLTEGHWDTGKWCVVLTSHSNVCLNTPTPRLLSSTLCSFREEKFHNSVIKTYSGMVFFSTLISTMC